MEVLQETCRQVVRDDVGYLDDRVGTQLPACKGMISAWWENWSYNL